MTIQEAKAEVARLDEEIEQEQQRHVAALQTIRERLIGLGAAPGMPTTRTSFGKVGCELARGVQ